MQGDRVLSGFTLIELLVVIAIIALLAALLFPVFASAKKSAKTSTTISNLRQLGVAIALYESDNDDHFPSSADGGIGTGKIGGWVFYDQFQSNGPGHFDVKKGTIYLYAKSDQIFVSPNDGKAQSTGLSFAINSCVINKINGTGMTPGKTSTDVADSGLTMLLGEEGTGLEGDHSNDTNDGYFAAKYDHFSEWNTGGSSILFVDSHVKVRHLQSDAGIALATSGGNPTFCD